MSPEERLLSVAEIARRLGVPESTVHYWKNRFAQHLPSSGAGRQKRFRPEAVEVFRIIAEMFSLGHSAQDVMEALGKNFPLTASLEGDHFATGSFREGADAPFSHKHPRESESQLADTAVRMAAAIAKEMGAEIARSIGEGLRQHLSGVAGAALGPGEAREALPSGLDAEELSAIKNVVEETCGRLDANADEVARMASENAELKAKLTVLESELIRLRKDRREMEKYLLDKIKAVTT
ncbi:MAG TPA: MerR family transcriptional regulator [Humidesulfovibrio sp.]|uniref:MerR family transcriptional regulator n=1 Tax=Humidesulfovibrio sp. TaxID=2910988 RepID=UPI002BD8B94D|nr:MerR family transcriptional regulator [Humidesulfovibrio sp.]HWR03515.1 MerR family transcriptional regulator [Humidesulfovibrio sp.]